jgi:hypothetical protein
MLPLDQAMIEKMMASRLTEPSGDDRENLRVSRIVV